MGLYGKPLGGRGWKSKIRIPDLGEGRANLWSSIHSNVREIGVFKGVSCYWYAELYTSASSEVSQALEQPETRGLGRPLRKRSRSTPWGEFTVTGWESSPSLLKSDD